MTTVTSLPEGCRNPSLKRLMKFVFQPNKYMEDNAKNYGDTFTLFNKSGNHLVYFCNPQALEEIFTADAGYLASGRAK
ncbi:hypothetical protein [Brunnivagina elsteri]|uniref:Cytochrome P450 n=1 Tax=Brunnivagina elsteri CCALA 953 TaxID=987040 RepID=A0A2A2TIP1_9CYAN|nr:hypothetical protein [Calothrix elsteri]PAX53498.1 hypothetical protein CK510_13630 [Calothrix elsteri CCALA 953]